MRRSLIFLSAVYLIVFGAFQIVRFIPRHDFIINQGYGTYRMFLAINLAIFTLFGLLSIIMGIGLIYRKNWARELLVVISILGLFFGVSIIICTICLRFMLPYGSLAVSRIDELYYWIDVIVCLILMPAFFIFFFTRRQVIAFFSRRDKDKKS